MSADVRETARLALLNLASAEIAGAASATLRAAAADAMSGAGVGTIYSHQKVRDGLATPRDLIDFAMRVHVVKRCACGGEISAFEWIRLPSQGRQDDGAGGWLELRRCSCGSTIALEIPKDAAPGAAHAEGG